MSQESLGAGAFVCRSFLSEVDQRELSEVVLETARWLSPVTPGGKPFSVKQTNFGSLGWISDRGGYRYVPNNPESNRPWPEMPQTLLDVWAEILPDAPLPECCLANWYVGAARMGAHTDSDEEDQETGLLTLSLGQSARFRLGGPKRGGKTQSIRLDSGDVLVMAGESRKFYHGVDRLLPDDPLFATDLGFEGRLSLTLRRVTRC